MYTPLFVSLAVALAPQDAGGADGFRERAARPVQHDAQTPATAKVILEGVVLSPDGHSSEGAIVVARSHEQAVTGADGRYRLAIDLEADRSRRTVELSVLDPTAERLTATGTTVQVELQSTELLDAIALGHVARGDAHTQHVNPI